MTDSEIRLLARNIVSMALAESGDIETEADVLRRAIDLAGLLATGFPTVSRCYLAHLVEGEWWTAIATARAIEAAIAAVAESELAK